MNYYSDLSYISSILGGLTLIALLIFLIVLVIYIVGFWKVFEKAGKPGWASIVPFYGNWILIEIAGLHWIYFVFLLDDFIIELFGITGNLTFILNLAALYSSFMYSYNISKKFNKGTGFSILLFLFGIVGYPILGFSKNAVYDDSIPVSEHGVFGNTKVNNNTSYTQNNDNMYQNYTSSEHSFCAHCGMKINNDVRFCPNCGKEVIK